MQIFFSIFNVDFFWRSTFCFGENKFILFAKEKAELVLKFSFGFYTCKMCSCPTKNRCARFLSATHNLALPFHLRSYGEKVRDGGSSQLTPFLKKKAIPELFRLPLTGIIGFRIFIFHYHFWLWDS